VSKKSFWFLIGACVSGIIFILTAKYMLNNPLFVGLSVGALGLFLINLAAAWGYRRENE
jgi:RsiW-degrading membrane proteinase PrsW (M82 family)